MLGSTKLEAKNATAPPPSMTHSKGKPTMIFRVPRPPASVLIVAGLILALGTTALRAQGASPWARSAHSSIRIVDGGPTSEGARLMGIEIALAPDYKTYWRDPGDSGLPPVFDWSASVNVKGVAVEWPVPHRFDDSAGSSIGYSEDVVLPILVTPSDPARPMTLRLKADYAVCSTICIPGRGETALVVDPRGRQNTEQAQRIGRFRSRVPAAGEIGDGSVPGAVRVAARPKAVEIEGRVPASAKIVDVFVEGPEGWLFGASVPAVVLPDGPAVRRIVWRAPVVDRPEGALLDGLAVTVTVATDDTGTEYRLTLDGGEAAR
jgi:DsbC/DsbD-like thiol-disulfide interchange protein